MRADCVRTNGRRNDECLCVVNDKWRKTILWALNNRFFALHEVQYVHASEGIVRHSASEPMPTSLDEFPRMKPGSLLATNRPQH